MDYEKEIVQLIQLALEGKSDDFKAYARKTLASINKRRPDLENISQDAGKALAGSVHRFSKTFEPLPVDLDSRQELVRRDVVLNLPSTITWPNKIQSSLNEIIEERKHGDKLLGAGLSPVRTILFVGQPGVGKTLAAQWIASALKRQLLTLDLSSVMSSYLGKTGNNIRAVLDFAKKSSSVLLLDEFDSIAKRRDDVSEVGELKRLVTVLLQSIDDWPVDGVLIAATNHPELLDPAVWRRFDRVIEFPKPDSEVRKTFLSKMLNETSAGDNKLFIDFLASITEEQSFANIKRDIEQAKKQSLISERPIEHCLEEMIIDRIEEKPFKARLEIAKGLIKNGHSQHRVNELTKVSRDTLRKHFPIKEQKKKSTNTRIQ